MDLRPIVNLGPLLAVANILAPDDGSVYVTTADGMLKRFSYPAFDCQATYRLEQPAYRAVADARRGLLWVAACNPRELRINEYGDRPEGCGDFHVYDLHALPPRQKEEERSRPCQVVALRGNVRELLASHDSRWLFYLARTAEGVHLGRIDAAARRIDARLSLPVETRSLCRTADGKTLYAAGGRKVFAVDPRSLRVLRRIEIDADINAVAADNEHRVYLAEEGQWTRLARLELSASKPIPWRWDAKLHGRVYLRMAPDQCRLYVGSSSPISSHLDSILIRGHGWKTPPQVGIAVPDAQGTIGGEFFLTPDGKYLLNRWGKVFRLAQGAMDVNRLGGTP